MHLELPDKEPLANLGTFKRDWAYLNKQKKSPQMLLSLGKYLHAKDQGDLCIS